MGLIVKEYTKRDGRGRRSKILLVRGFDSPGIFDIPYNAALHRHFILHELRFCTGRPPAYLNRGRNKKKSERLGRYERHLPSMWKAAILRDAPLLKGFFEEEPAWRDKMLRWCRVIGKIRSCTNLGGKRVRREPGAFEAESAAWTARTRPARLGSRGPLSTSTHTLSSGGDFENGLNARCASTARTCAILRAPAAGWLSNVR